MCIKQLKLWPEDWSQNSWTQDLNRPRTQKNHKTNKLRTVFEVQVLDVVS